MALMVNQSKQKRRKYKLRIGEKKMLIASGKQNKQKLKSKN
jgi:hypothetical protein